MLNLRGWMIPFRYMRARSECSLIIEKSMLGSKKVIYKYPLNCTNLLNITQLQHAHSTSSHSFSLVLFLIIMLPILASAAFAGFLASQAYASPVDLGGLGGLDSVTDVLDDIKLSDLASGLKRGLPAPGLDSLTDVTSVLDVLNLDSASSGLSGAEESSSSSASKIKTTPTTTPSSRPNKRQELNLNIIPTPGASPIDLTSLIETLDTSPIKKRTPLDISLEQGLIPLIPGVTEPLTKDASIPLPILQLPLPPLESEPFNTSNIKPKKIGYFWTGAGDNQHKDFLVTTSLDDVSFEL
jgi:hypothetical protein